VSRIIAVAADSRHRFSKPLQERIELVAGLGVAGDAHSGATIQHRSRWAKAKEEPNLRQVHLLHAELFGEMRQAGFEVSPGQMGENVTTEGIDLLSLPLGTQLRLGPEALVELTGLRNPCSQIDKNIGRGAMAATLERGEDGRLIRKSGVMAVVVEGGEVRPGDTIMVERLPRDAVPLEPI